MYFLFFHEEDKKGFYSKYIGGDGLEADVVELPDGTHISLGSKTTFHYDKDYGKDKRIVYLKEKPILKLPNKKTNLSS